MTKKQDQIEELLERLASGEESLTSICKDDHMPSKSAFLDWCDADQNLADQYARAREIGFDARADLAVQNAKEAEDAALGRLAFDADRWYLGKLAAKRYGDRLTHAGDPDAPIETKSTIDVSGLSEATLREIAALNVSR